MRTEFPVTDDGIKALKIRVLRDLAAHRYPREALPTVAVKHHITVDDAKALVEKHGWPEASSMGRAADVLEGKTPAPVAAAVPVPNRLPAASGVSTAPVPKPTAPRPAPSIVGAARPTPMANGTELLLVDAEKSAKARTVRLATKIRDDLWLLRELVIAERKETEAAKLKAEETARLKAEVADLERQLAEKRAALRPVAAKLKPSTSKAASLRGNKTIRAWAEEHDIECPAFGRVPQLVVDAYDAAHPSEGTPNEDQAVDRCRSSARRAVRCRCRADAGVVPHPGPGGPGGRRRGACGVRGEAGASAVGCAAGTIQGDGHVGEVVSIFNRPRLHTPALSDGTTPPPTPRPPTHGQAWHELHDMCHKLGVDLDHEHIEALTVQDFMRLAYAGGYKACERRLSSPDVADGIAQAIGNPGSIVERAWQTESVANWSVRAVQQVVAYGVPK